MKRREVRFFVDGKPARTLVTDVPLDRAIDSLIQNLRFVGIYLDGKTVRAEAGGSTVERRVIVNGRRRS